MVRIIWYMYSIHFHQLYEVINIQVITDERFSRMNTVHIFIKCWRPADMCIKTNTVDTLIHQILEVN